MIIDFNSVWGQEKACAMLSQNLERGKTASAYLFAGPQGIGKMLTAKIFAQALLCESANRKPCGVCRPCKMFKAGAHPDFMGIVPTEPESKNPNFKELVRHPDKIGVAKKGLMIRIGQVRELINGLSLKSYTGARKVVLVEDAERMNRQTANAFLKTLEEPSEDTVLILVTSNSSVLLPTVVSRCRSVRFTPIPPEKLGAMLEKHLSIPPEEALALALLAEGCPGRALGGDMDHIREIDREAHELAGRMLEMAPEEVTRIAEGWKNRRNDIPLLIERLMEILRTAQRPNLAVRSDNMRKIMSIFSNVPQDRLLAGYEALLDSMSALGVNPNIQLFMESTVYNLQSILNRGEPLARREF